MFNKKGQGISINVIIIVAIALVVLIVLIVIFTSRVRILPGTLKDCVAQGGHCVYSRDECPGAILPGTDCSETGQLCCIEL